MKEGWIKGMAVGSVLGAAALATVGMMNQKTQRKMQKMAATGGKMIRDKAEELFGRYPEMAALPCGDSLRGGAAFFMKSG